MRALLPVLFCIAGGSLALRAATVFQEGFEEESLGPEWALSATEQGRVTVDTQHEPATGLKHLILDDSVSDATFSAAEAILRVDLEFQKEVVLTFKAKSLGNDAHPPPEGNFTATRDYDGVAISADNGVTWRTVQSLAGVGATWQTFTVPLDEAVDALGGTYGPTFMIRFSGYDNAPVPADGLALDDVSIDAVPDQLVVVDLASPVV